jgi:O-antigen ligase
VYPHMGYLFKGVRLALMCALVAVRAKGAGYMGRIQHGVILCWCVVGTLVLLHAYRSRYHLVFQWLLGSMGLPCSSQPHVTVAPSSSLVLRE